MSGSEETHQHYILIKSTFYNLDLKIIMKLI